MNSTNVKNVRQPKTVRKPRVVRYERLHGFEFQGAMEIEADGIVTIYCVENRPCGFGQAFRLVKTTPGTDASQKEYNVLLADDGRDHCCCRGASRFGSCRHIQALRALEKAGKL